MNNKQDLSIGVFWSNIRCLLKLSIPPDAPIEGFIYYYECKNPLRDF
jgi:hypothetical protein